jgi:antimicrobial peptide system SdpB family protein
VRLRDLEDRAAVVGLARSLLAAAQLATLGLSPIPVLFAALPRQRCGGLAAGSLWCLTGTGSAAAELARASAVLVLVSVLVGYRPRWTCVPHCYVAFSLHVGLAAPNGGDLAGQLMTLLLVPLCLGDNRTWLWGRRPPVEPVWRGAARAAGLAVRLQLLILYGWAAVAKLTAPGWREGTAMRAILHDPIYGLPPAARRALEAPLDARPLMAMLTWSVIAGELAIALSMTAGWRVRRRGWVLALLLHATIVASMGLFSFGVTMIAFVLLACADDRDFGSDLPEGATDRGGRPRSVGPPVPALDGRGG